MACSIDIVSVQATRFDTADRVVGIRVNVKCCQTGANVTVLGSMRSGNDINTQYRVINGIGIWSIDFDLTMGKYQKSIGCNDTSNTIKVYAECLEDTNNNITVNKTVECCPAVNSCKLEITLTDGSGPYTPFQISERAEDPSGPGCNLPE